MTDSQSPSPTVVDGVRFENPVVRKRVGIILYVLLFLVALTLLALGFFPELQATSPVDIDRVVNFVSAAVLLFASWFGFRVTTPNVPVKQ